MTPVAGEQRVAAPAAPPLVNGEVTLQLPIGWMTPQSLSTSVAGYATALVGGGTVAVSVVRVITVSSLNLAVTFIVTQRRHAAHELSWWRPGDRAAPRCCGRVECPLVPTGRTPCAG